MTTNDPSNRTVRLRCHGRVRVPFYMSPRSAAFGQVPRGAGPRYRTITLTRGDGGPIAPELSTPTLPGLGAQICEIEPGERYEVEVWMMPPWPSQKFRDFLQITTGVDEVPTIPLTVSGRMLPRLTAVPGRLNFSLERPADVTRTMEFRWDGPRGKILSAESTLPGLSTELKVQNGVQVVEITMLAGSTAAGTKSAVVVRTDDPEVPTLEIPTWFRSTTRAQAGRQPAARTVRAQPVNTPKGQKATIKR